MKCNCCGKDIGEFSFDQSYQMPDDIWNLSSSEREERTQIDSDLCRLDNRYFIRGVAYLPVTETNEKFGWGIWAEVPEEKFIEYVRRYEEDNSKVEPYKALVANSLPNYSETKGIELLVHLGNESQRPKFIISESEHLLTKEQINGIPLSRIHEFNRK